MNHQGHVVDKAGDVLHRRLDRALDRALDVALDVAGGVEGLGEEAELQAGWHRTTRKDLPISVNANLTN